MQLVSVLSLPASLLKPASNNSLGTTTSRRYWAESYAPGFPTRLSIFSNSHKERCTRSIARNKYVKRIIISRYSFFFSYLLAHSQSANTSHFHIWFSLSACLVHSRSSSALAFRLHSVVSVHFNNFGYYVYMYSLINFTHLIFAQGDALVMHFSYISHAHDARYSEQS